VGATTVIPFGDNFSNEVIFPEGYRLGPGDSLVASYYAAVTPGYFEAMRIRLVSGRFFDDRDAPDSRKTVIVDERLARRYWPGLDPIGRRMYEPEDEKDLTAITNQTKWYTVVGVVGEVKVRGLVEGVGETGAFYMPQAHRPARRLTFAIRTAGSAPSAIAGAVRREMARLDRELALFDEKTMVERIEKSLVTRRTPMLLAIAFGLLALFLSVIGIYGVLAYLVSQRTKEIGIRIALGSSKAAVVHLVLREGIVLIAGGLVAGAAGAAALTRSLEGQLFGVRATDPFVLSLAVAILGLAGLAACALPARRATRISPAVALGG
jgi:predicted permease